MRSLGGKFWLALASCCAFAGAAQAQSLPALASPDGHFEVSLHARRQRSSARAEQAAWLSVTVPLEKLAVPAPAAAVAKAPAAAGAAPPVAPQPTPAPEPPAPLVSFQQLRALTEFSRRATVVALGVAGAAADRRRVDSLAGRARSSALLPELRLRALRNTDQALRLSPTTDDPYRITQADGAGLVLEASATFRLDRLLFAREELTVERLRQQAGEARLKLEARVQAALLGLFRARQLSCAGEPDDQKALQTLKVVELFAELDNLTAGWFSDQAASFGRAVWGFPEAVLAVCSPPEAPPAPAGTNPVASLENSE
jgi:hypothetical protein